VGFPVREFGYSKLSELPLSASRGVYLNLQVANQHCCCLSDCVLRVVGLSRVPSWASSAPPFERAVSMGPSRFLTHCLLRLATMPPIVLGRLLQRLLLVPEPASPCSVSSACKQSSVRLNFSTKPHLPGCFAVSFSPGFFRLSTDILVSAKSCDSSPRCASTLASRAAILFSESNSSTLLRLKIAPASRCVLFSLIWVE